MRPADGRRCKVACCVPLVLAALAILPNGITGLSAAQDFDPSLEVIEVRWGFDARAVPARINLLSVLVANPRTTPFDGVATLRGTGGPVGELGALHARPIYVSPGQRRWVQFYQYVGDSGGSYELRLGATVHNITVNAMQLGPPAVVLLTDPESVYPAPTKLPRMPDNLFPVAVGATDGLWALLLDHAPRWEAVRRRALIDWLRRGGTLHLLRDAAGAYPEFTSELAVLNEPAERFRVGAGLVVRHRRTRRDIAPADLRALGFSRPVEPRDADVRSPRLDQSIFEGLTELAMPGHQWWLIFLLLLTYVAVVGPGNFILARKVQDCRWAFAFFFGAVALFCVILSLVGRRGFNEVTGVRSFTYARPVAPGSYDVTHWANAFVTWGGNYEITYSAPHGVFSTCQEMESVPGVINSGPEAAFRVSLPVYSSRGYLYRGKLAGPRLAPRATRLRHDTRLRELVIATGPEFPADMIEALVVCKGSVGRMEFHDGELRLDPSWREARAEKFFQPHPRSVDPWMGHANPHTNAGTLFRELAPALMARALWASQAGGTYVDPGYAASDSVHLFVLAESPPTFHCTCARLRSESGYVLYHLDVARPEDTDD